MRTFSNEGQEKVNYVHPEFSDYRGVRSTKRQLRSISDAAKGTKEEIREFGE